MAVKKSSKPAVPTAADFKVGDIVLTKLKGFPEWPGKIIDPETASDDVKSARAGKHILVRFYPDADYVWAYPRELKQLTHKIIDAFLSEPSKKQGKLKYGYEIARDPTAWEAEQAEKDARANEPEEEEEEVADDVDMLAEDGEGASAGKKRKRASEGKPANAKQPKKKETASKGKKEPPAKKQKTIPAKKSKSEKTEKAPKEKKDKPASATPAAAASGEEDTSEEAKTVKGWRATLQKAFLTKGVPSAEEMPKYDAAFSAMEKFEMQAQWLASSKLGKVLKKMAVLTEEIPREAEFKIKERSNALMDKWKSMLNAQPAASAPSGGEATAAGDLTIVKEDDKKEEEKMETDAAPETAAPAAAAAEPAEKKEEDKPVTTNGVNGAVNAEGQTNGVPEPAAAEEKKAESVETPSAPAAAPKENGVVSTETPATTA